MVALLTPPLTLGQKMLAELSFPGTQPVQPRPEHRILIGAVACLSIPVNGHRFASRFIGFVAKWLGRVACEGDINAFSKMSSRLMEASELMKAMHLDQWPFTDKKSRM